MDDNSALIEALLREDEERAAAKKTKNDDVYGWQTVSYHKKNRKPSRDAAAANAVNGSHPNGDDVFRSIGQQSDDRRRRVEDAQIAASADSAGAGSKRHSDDSDEEVPAAQNGAEEAKKTKPKKPKKPKVSVAEAASKIDVDDLGAFLADITDSYESRQDIQLMRFADYFGRAFAGVSAAQFPWLKTFKESNVTKLVDIPLSHISEKVYKTSIDWIGQRSSDALLYFMRWSLDSVLDDLAIHQGVAKGSKKVAQQAPSKSQVAMFVVLAMLLRRKPDVLISFLPKMKESPKYQGQDKLPLTVWLISQASVGDLAVGLYMWAHFLLPMLSSKSTCNPQSRDLILQLVQRILSAPKARSILLNGAVRKGERLVPPSALDILMRVTFPSPSSRVRATERFEAIYPTLKEIALAGSPESKAMKQTAQQILTFAIKAVKEDISDLSREASDTFIWCLTRNPECCKQWDLLYLENLEAGVVILKRLSSDWNVHSAKHLSLDPLRETVKSFRQKNSEELAKDGDGARHALLKEAEKYSRVILGRLSQGHGCPKSLALLSIALGAVAAIMSQNLQSWDLKSLSDLLGRR
ncbi:uncharacterized protein LOC21409821 [Morus notabilis]|uniref:uncharacterized protein LOC21409821 n=1 Tax=Morus notabilis TaxID=981085 RepID=UPI000CED238D|nr:uncharacterized protein LOC21409821 [Morus notabilis]